MYADKQIVLYEYQPSRKADHPMEFLKNFSGVCVTDGYQVYHTIEKERDDLKIAGCWAHARRRFNEAVKAQPNHFNDYCTYTASTSTFTDSNPSADNVTTILPVSPVPRTAARSFPSYAFATVS